MKTLIILICAFTFNLSAQTAKTATFVVKGNCEECKTRIENAADIKGVKILTWNQDTKVAKVIYDPAKTDLQHIQEAIASKGHDVGDHMANQKAYNKLPQCCKYRDGKCEEAK